MTPERALHRDHREDIEGLVHRGRIELPEVILADGTASRSQFATVPPGVSLTKAFLPYREVDGTWSNWTGAALVGTRQPDIGPYLPGSSSVLLVHIGRFDITRPQSAGDILNWLYHITGIGYAPAAFWKVAGWEVNWAANWLDALLSGGRMAELIIAERQAAAAVRAASISHREWESHASVLMHSGMLFAARSLIDMTRLFDTMVTSALRDTTDARHRKQANETCAILIQRLRSCIQALEDAAQSRTLNHDRYRKVGKAIEHAREIVEAFGLFTAVGEEIGERVVRLSTALAIKGRPPRPSETSFAAEVDLLSERVESLIEGAPFADHLPSWSSLTTGDLSRLQLPVGRARLDLLSRVRTDLIYKLVVTRRLDRVFEALPWLAAPSGAFRLTFGGPLGAMAALFEIARGREIALELKARLFDSESGPRLDTRRGKREIGDTFKLRREVGLGNRVGFLLASSAMSHHMVKAFLAGRHFDPAHPLAAFAAGQLAHNFAAAAQDADTRATISTTELASRSITAQDTSATFRSIWA